MKLVAFPWAAQRILLVVNDQANNPPRSGYAILLDLYLFRTLGEVRQMTEKWMVRYNKERPHDSLNDMTPVEYLRAHNHSGISNLAWD